MKFEFNLSIHWGIACDGPPPRGSWYHQHANVNHVVHANVAWPFQNAGSGKGPREAFPDRGTRPSILFVVRGKLASGTTVCGNQYKHQCVWTCILKSKNCERGKRVVILRGQILVRRSGDLIDGSIMAPIQPLALGLIAALLFCYICFAFLPSAQRIYIERCFVYFVEDMGKYF